MRFTWLAVLALLAVQAVGQSDSGTYQVPDVKLATGEFLSQWGQLSDTKLRRGSALYVRHVMSAGRTTCFSTIEDVGRRRSMMTMQLEAPQGLTANAEKFPSEKKKLKLDGITIENCADFPEIMIKVQADAGAPRGVQKVKGRVSFQLVNEKGSEAVQQAEFEVPVEVVEANDRTAKHNQAFSYRPGADVIWRVPTFPFYLIYSAVACGGACD